MIEITPLSVAKVQPAFTVPSACPDLFGNNTSHCQTLASTRRCRQAKRKGEGAAVQGPTRTQHAKIQAHRTTPRFYPVPTRAFRLRRMHASREQPLVPDAVAQCGRVLVQSVVFRDRSANYKPPARFCLPGTEPCRQRGLAPRRPRARGLARGAHRLAVWSCMRPWVVCEAGQVPKSIPRQDTRLC